MTVKLPAKPVSASAVRDQVHLIFPNDLNANDTAFGGMIMAHMDRIAAVVAGRHAEGTCVTASVDAVHFIAPARRGDVLIFSAAVNRSWTSSMEVGCRVEAESASGGARRHILSAYLTFVALDAYSKPRPVAPLTPETTDEQHRHVEAQWRREQRLKQAQELSQLREQAGRH